MPQLIKMAGLVLAEKVLHEMESLINGHEDGYPIRVSGFCNYKTTGYHLSADGRNCSIINHPVSDSIRIVYGTVDDFDSSTNIADPNLEYVDVLAGEYYVAATLAINWLLKGIDPNQDI